jgi:hypothetical protein
MRARTHPPRISSRSSLWISLTLWALALVLSLLQADQEAVRWSTPYGLKYLRTLIVPTGAILVFYLLALNEHYRNRKPVEKPPLWGQVFLLILVLTLTYWAAVAPLRPNWLLLLGVWWLLPSLYLGNTGMISPTTLLSLGSLIFTIILVEILIRPFPQLWPGYARMVGSNWRHIHADIPTLEYEVKGIEYKINRLGFRGLDPVPDQVDIVALGDSNTFGVGTRQPWPEHLSDLMEKSVLNLGMGGTDPPKHVYPLIAYGLTRAPEFAIETYFEGNDLYTCYQPAKPAGPRWGDRLVLPDLIAGIKEMIRFLGREQVLTSEITYDIATPFIRSIGGQQVELTFSPAYAATLLLDEATIRGSENWRIASGSLKRMAELSQEAGTTFILIYLPERTHVYWPLIRDDDELVTQLNQDMTYAWDQRFECLTLIQGRTPDDLETFRAGMNASLNAQRDLLQTFAETQDIAFLDLTPSLQRLAQQGVTLADPLETHYNDFVNQIMAEEIAEFLLTLDQ